MITWLLNPKNLLLTALAALVIIIGGLYLWQREALKEKEVIITKQTGDIAALNFANNDLQGQVHDYKANIEAMKKAQAQQQKIANNTAILLSQAQKITSSCRIGENDEKIISNATYYFNYGLLRNADCNPKAGGKVLSKASTSNADGSRWSVRQIIENYIIIIDYILKLERTVSCYETVSP